MNKKKIKIKIKSKTVFNNFRKKFEVFSNYHYKIAVKL